MVSFPAFHAGDGGSNPPGDAIFPHSLQPFTFLPFYICIRFAYSRKGLVHALLQAIDLLMDIGLGRQT